MVDIPAIRVNSGRGPITQDHPSGAPNKERRLTNGAHPWDEAEYPRIEDAQKIMYREKWSIADLIDNRLRENNVRDFQAPHSGSYYFWPPKLFDYLFQEKDVEYVVDELIQKHSLPVDQHRGREYWTDEISGRGSSPLVYRRLLAILLLVGKPQCIHKCIIEKLADQHLPLDPRKVGERMGLRGRDMDLFTTYQLGFSIPLFKPPQRRTRLGVDVSVCHVDLTQGQVLPWDYLDKEPKRTAAEDYALPIPSADSHTISASMTLGGGFGEVRRIIIHPWQHDFQDILESWSSNRNVFALKRLFTSDSTKFENERTQLTRFGGQHNHIVTLLATIASKIGNRLEYYLLFPWAEADLLNYWKSNARPERSYEMFQWVVDQCYGIVDAVAFIHNPGARNSQGQPVFGRHGDIKPENILWFQKNRDSNGMGALVLSDLGLAATHRDQSRSNVPGEAIPATPNYRPPECDMDGKSGQISRSFDIWTLGCLFLELLVWVLNGWKGRQDFRMDRCMSPYLNGETDVYFDIMRTKGERNTAEYFFQVKEQVTKCIVGLHRNRNCTLLIHDFLDLIQDRMLIVQSDEPPVKRIGADELREKVKMLVDRCRSDKSYCMDPCPAKAEQELTQQRYEPVKAKLNKVAMDALRSDGRFENLALHSGKSRTVHPRKNYQQATQPGDQ